MKLHKAWVLCALFAFPLCGHAQAPTFNSTIAPATPAVTVVKQNAGYLSHISCFNLLATPVYVKLFDVSGTITLGTTNANYEFMCPGNTAGAGFVVPLTSFLTFSNSIKYAVTGGIAFNDNTSITASSVIVNVGFN